MKKIILVPSLLMFLLMSPILTYAHSDYYQPAKKSDEELMMDLFFSLLLPTVQEEVCNYYSDSLIECPMVYPYQIKILKMERTNHYRGYIFSVKIEITPVVGAHNPVGKDQLTYTITPSEVTLEDFKHLKTFDLPPHLQDLKK